MIYPYTLQYTGDSCGMKVRDIENERIIPVNEGEKRINVERNKQQAQNSITTYL